ASHRSARLRRAEEYEHLRRRSPQPGLALLEPLPRERERRVVAELRQRDRRGNLPGWILLAEHGAEPIDRAQIAELAEERGERRLRPSRNDSSDAGGYARSAPAAASAGRPPCKIAFTSEASDFLSPPRASASAAVLRITLPSGVTAPRPSAVLVSVASRAISW